MNKVHLNNECKILQAQGIHQQLQRRRILCQQSLSEYPFYLLISRYLSFYYHDLLNTGQIAIQILNTSLSNSTQKWTLKNCKSTCAVLQSFVSNQCSNLQPKYHIPCLSFHIVKSTFTLLNKTDTVHTFVCH